MKVRLHTTYSTLRCEIDQTYFRRINDLRQLDLYDMHVALVGGSKCARYMCEKVYNKCPGQKRDVMNENQRYTVFKA